MEIKIIGSNCSNGIKLKKELKRVVEKRNEKIQVIELNEPTIRKRYQVQNIPALLIENEIVSEGKILNERELKRIITEYSVS